MDNNTNDGLPDTFQTEMVISTSGDVMVSERGDRVGNGGAYGSSDLVRASNRIQLSIGIEEDQAEGTVALNFASYHIVNSETGRAFHVSGDADLGWDQIVRIHRFLTYLLSDGRQ